MAPIALVSGFQGPRRGANWTERDISFETHVCHGRSGTGSASESPAAGDVAVLSIITRV